MAYLVDIVNTINAALKDKLTAFPRTRYAGVVYHIAKDASKFLPAEIEGAEGKVVSFDDLYEMSVYHRLAASTYTQTRNQSYGDGYTDFQQNYEIDLVVMADRTKVQTTPDILEAVIASNMPTPDMPQGVNYINILPVSANHNSRSLFSQEFPGVTYYLKPEHIFFSIRYRIELRYQKGCLSLCQCE